MHTALTFFIVCLPIVLLSNFGETTAVTDVFHLARAAADKIFTTTTSHVYTADGCAKDSHCAYPRKCRDNSNVTLTKACDEASKNSNLPNPCVCAYPEGFKTCQSSSDCAHGDRCINVNNTESLLRGNACFSCQFAALFVAASPEGVSNVDSDPESCKTYTGLWCENDSHCASPRECKDSSDVTVTRACDETSQDSGLPNPCICMYPEGYRICDTSSACAFGDRCISVNNTRSDLNGKNVCMSCIFSEVIIDANPDGYSRVDAAQETCRGIFENNGTEGDDATDAPTTSDEEVTDSKPDTTSTDDEETDSEPESDGEEGSNDNGDSSSTDSDNDDSAANGGESSICIAVSSLSGLHPSKLVYAQHRKAVVLCDSFDNCATPGHIVEYKGKAMMMKSYCGLLEKCVRRVKLVNSIRMEAGFRVQSKSSDMKFTALSARYETRMEEAVLGHIIRLGM